MSQPPRRKTTAAQKAGTFMFWTIVMLVGSACVWLFMLFK